MVEILKSGLYDSIQDLGRQGYQSFGVPMSGAMDQYASKLANAILGNQPDAAVLEFTLVAPQLRFHTPTAICITGMESEIFCNKKPVDTNTYIRIMPEDLLTFGQRRFGCRGYIAVLGGFQSECVMNSRSFYKMVTAQDRLKVGDHLSILKLSIKNSLPNAVVNTPELHYKTDILEVFKGPEFESLCSKQQEFLLTHIFTISKDSNRMAYQVTHRVQNAMDAIITVPVLPGTVQLTPSGQLILLMRDCQTTGGYPRVLQLSEMAINRLSQKIPGNRFKFRLLTI